MHFDSIDQQLFDKDRRRRQIVLLLRNHVRVGRIRLKPLDHVATRLIAVIQQLFPAFRRGIQNSHRRAQHVIGRIAQAPPAASPGARIKYLGLQVLFVARELVDGVKVRSGVTIERRLREERNGIAEAVYVIDEARIPVVEASAMHCARHIMLVQIGRHRRAEFIDPSPH